MDSLSLYNRGQALFEVALVLPIFLLIVIGMTKAFKVTEENIIKINSGPDLNFPSPAIRGFDQLSNLYLKSNTRTKNELLEEQNKSGWSFQQELGTPPVYFFSRGDQKRIFQKSSKNFFEGVELWLKK